jgi:hypothetical protein
MSNRTAQEYLREFNDVYQNEPGIRRRWFSDSSYELIVWYRGIAPIGFQICYRSSETEYAITWSEGYFSHRSIVDEDDKINRTPILNGSAALPGSELMEDFMNHAIHLEPEITGYIRGVLEPRFGSLTPPRA